MFYKKCGLLLALLLLLVSVSGVCATDNNTDSLNPVGDNSLELNNTVLCVDDVDLINNETTNTISNDSVDLSTVPCAVESYIGVMKSYNKTVDVETGIKETHTVNNTTSILGLTNAFTNQGLKSNVIKTKSIEDLKELHKDKRIKIIVHMSIDDEYHFAYIKEIVEDGLLFNNNWFLFYDDFKQRYSNLAILITNIPNVNLSCFGENINQSKWFMITGKLSEREIYNSNMGLIGVTLNHISDKSLKKLNAILNPMQKSLNKTIEHLNYLKKEIIHHSHRNNNLKASNVVSPKMVDVPKLLGDGCNLFIDNLKEAINNLNPLNAHPELREKLDQKYGLDHHTFGFIDYYTFKK